MAKKKRRPAIYDCFMHIRKNTCAYLHWVRGTSPRPVGECKKCKVTYIEKE